ncbi:uncharacterized protein B0P05DRAFT_565574 [Gilbertella persicaria]|uniref:uncharacterized protein n=1 Tax=Gilbertella persicaria TaxID=101096 RepID=UPI002220BA21|nr:uncharacterized protein B0P05DRAFT_565574 [Gilbertella persicaria]KAI8047678.1 hypothetical protein B0P05DRAFT_565574 [Gilbertella persicaria]
MNKKTKKGYLWAFEQQDKWDDLCSEKILQLDQIAKSHMDWLDRHSTASDLISWKRPAIDLKRYSSLVQDVKQPSVDESFDQKKLDSLDQKEIESLPDHDINHHSEQSNEVHDSKADSPKQSQDDAQPPIDTQSKDTKDPPKDKIENNTVEQKSTIEIRSDQSDITVSSMPLSSSQQRHVSDIVPDSTEYDEQDDEIQLVVYKRHYEPKSPKREESPPPSSVMPMISPPPPIKTIASSMPFKPHNSFMSRLFRMGAIKRTKEDSPLSADVITTRPLSSSPKSTAVDIGGSIVHPTMDQPIQVNDVEPQLKRPRILLEAKKTAKPPKQEETEQEEFEIPSWAESPELEQHLRNQSRLDPDKIFGKMPPLQIQAIFPRTRPIIPEEAPP